MDKMGKIATVPDRSRSGITVPGASASGVTVPCASPQGITVCIVHYNTPELTAAAVRSLWKHTPAARVVIFDNSDRRPFCVGQGSALTKVEVIDNTQSQLINWPEWIDQFTDREPHDGNNYGSAKHCYSVQWLINHTDEPFLLMDSDVLVMRDVAPLCQRDMAFVGRISENTSRRFGFVVLKADPFICWINVPMIKRYGVTYFNPTRMWNLVPTKPYNRYDTGAWFLKDCQRHHLPYNEVNIFEYILHLGHASWRDRGADQWLRDHRDLWQ